MSIERPVRESSQVPGGFDSIGTTDVASAIDEFVNRQYSPSTRNSYRWRLGRFAVYMGLPEHARSEAINRLAAMDSEDGQSTALGFGAWLRSRKNPVRSKYKRGYGIAPLIRHLESRGLLKWKLPNNACRASLKSWDYCSAAFRVFAFDWLEAIAMAERPKSTANNHRRSLCSLGQFLERESLSIAKLRYPHVMKWIAELRDQRIAPPCINARLYVSRRFYQWVFRKGLVSRNPFSAVLPLRVVTRLPRHLDSSEILKLIHASRSTQERAIIELLYATGCRASELADLKREDISLRKRTVRFSGNHGLCARVVPLNHSATRALAKHLRGNPPDMAVTSDSVLFVSFLRKGFSDRSISLLVGRLAQRAAIGRRVPSQMIRNSFAKHFLDRGGDAITLKHLLGLSTLIATNGYSNLSVEQLQKTYQRTHPRA